MKTKSRNLGICSTVDWYDHGFNGSPDWGKYHRSYDWPAGCDTITYDEGPSHRDGMPLWKSCRHTGIAKCAGGCDLSYRFLDTAVMWGHDGHISVNAPYLCLGADSSSSIWSKGQTFIYGGTPQNYDWSDLLSEAIEGFYDSLDLNFQNTALTYSNIAQLIPLGGTLLRVNHLLGSLGRRFRKFRNRPIRSVLKAAIDADFIDRFVVQPTLSDISSIATAWSAVATQLFVRDNRNTGRYLGYKVTKNTSTLVKALDSSSSPIPWFTQPPYLSGQRTLTATTTASLTLDVVAAVKYERDPEAHAKLIAQRLGLTRPLDDLWDLVPFSFLADYFVGIGDFIHQFSREISDVGSLKGQVASLRGVWTQTKLRNTITVDGKVIATDRYGAVVGASPARASIESFDYVRAPMSTLDILSAVGNHPSGLLTPELSSRKKQTLVELVVQHFLR